VTACASATHCIGEALSAIQEGEADLILAGGTEATITPLVYAGFDNMNAMAKNFNDEPTKGSRPFDKNRCGFVMAEGAGVLLLESLEHAEKRGAKIYCELAGYGASCDANHITTPDPEGKGLKMALGRALRNGMIPFEDLGYINAHGTSTPYNDKFETMAIKGLLGDLARNVKISSTKSVTGHPLGAAGGLEAAVCAKVLETGDIPPTMNYETFDPDCDLDYVPNKKIHVDGIKAAASNSLGFGGHNGVVSFRKL
jgi:3-oxoacyl-[acyl-carrier-protein] synthase II